MRDTRSFSLAFLIWCRFVQDVRPGQRCGREDRSGAAPSLTGAWHKRRYQLFTVSRLMPKAAAIRPSVSLDSTRVTMDCRAHADSRAFLWVSTGAPAVVSGRLDNLNLLLLSPVNDLPSIYI